MNIDDKKLRSIFIEINFTDRYKVLSDSYQFNDNDNILDHKIVSNLILDLGYKSTYNKAHTFYKIIEVFNMFKTQFNISIKYGNVELIWGLWYNDNLIRNACGPWAQIYEFVLESDQRILDPKYRNYEDLKNVLKEAFNIYEDFKCCLVTNCLSNQI